MTFPYSEDRRHHPDIYLYLKDGAPPSQLGVEQRLIQRKQLQMEVLSYYYYCYCYYSYY